MYLLQKLEKYKAQDLSPYASSISQLTNDLKTWASSCYINILESGSRAKGTAISIASDVDYLISLTSDCGANNKGLKGVYDSLHAYMLNRYPSTRPQNVSFRINLHGLEVDITPASKYAGHTNYHSLYVSKKNTWKQTNIQKHISDISLSGRTNEIKILKIWRELNGLDFPSIYLEYLLINVILLNKSKDKSSLEVNVWHAFNQLAVAQNNPLFTKIVDPANTNNILSDLLNDAEKNQIISRAKTTISKKTWEEIIW